MKSTSKPASGGRFGVQAGALPEQQFWPVVVAVLQFHQPHAFGER
jgi:hypothetical protein